VISGQPAIDGVLLMQPSKFLDRKAASEYLLNSWGLKRSPNYLAKLAVVGGGPAFRKANRDVIYENTDLDEYAESIIGPRIRSTSEIMQGAA
jgi:hypothetical protein